MSIVNAHRRQLRRRRSVSSRALNYSWASFVKPLTRVPPELKWGPKPPSLLKHFRDLLSHCIHLLDWVIIERENGNKMQQHPVVTSKKPRISPASIHTTCNWFLGKYSPIRAPVPTPGMQKWSQALVWRSPQKMHTHLCSAGRCSAALCALQCELLMIREHPPSRQMRRKAQGYMSQSIWQDGLSNSHFLKIFCPSAKD